MKRIAILASGSGTNAENIIKYFQKNNVITITQVLSNKKDAKVLDRAKRLNIKRSSFSRDDFFKTDKVLDILKKEADYIVLAGFLWKIPENIINAFVDKIINIHPALLPKYGGKGMYGDNVHKAVVANKEKETGITIHYVNENYDEGAIIFQAKVSVGEKDTFENVAQKVHQLEYEHFPRVIEETILKN
ncbi:phosphoribosylglycinamide formyltransferase [Aureibaculum sp. 2210JD6-5]|uniref:phosphoribosylglycinamide formyltransferase n=1 Tax=Aureibaculum sp. 2210JD6-5 TaxID=3103957 RepID=UPI002AADBB0D|nr:phosphoribosylglycinamide formyltransferase [Aureibaculum sp. 2210JD6-5]MDY7395970.1 phosphoribosylglycinamide formyltransferase [Aureibaculum sp. 2210JD6-5]